MTILNGHFYHFRSDGVVTEEPDSSRVPFAVITAFRSEARFSTNGASMDKLGQQIDQHIPSTNLFYAIRIHGNFSELTTRAIPKLFPPYCHYLERSSNKSNFHFRTLKVRWLPFAAQPGSKVSTRSVITITSSQMTKTRAATH
jgi:acetolactate decarboxylase